MIIKLGYGPNNITIAQEIINNKNTDLAALRKQLKLPSTEDPQTKEHGEQEKKKKNLFKIIIEQNNQIAKMEKEMEILLKEKEQQYVSAYAIPLVVIPMTATSTIEASTSAIAITTTEDQSNNTPLDLAKAMENMSIKEHEIEKLTAKMNNLQQKIEVDIVYLAELQKTHRLTQRIEYLENKSIMADTMAQAKENIWLEINEAITKIWPSIEIIFEQNELVHRNQRDS